MATLRVRPTGGHGRVHHVTPKSAGWTHVGFDLHRLSPGESATAETGSRETCLVFVAGTGSVTAGGADLGALGGRTSPFEGPPWSVYVPAGSSWRVEATGALDLAVCSAPGRPGAHPVRVIAPDTLGQEVRGTGTNVRHVTNILPETDTGADALLVVEVITPGGHTSSYPPHRHDENDLPRQSLLEESYYHRLHPPQGFAFQRVYTEARPDGTREIDEAMVLEDGDVTLVPKGYHPCAAVHGYDLYYLNVMAGPVRTWRFHNEPAHQWLMRKG